jgi:subfamily B ATP-binding cassette protein MsbA
LSGEVKWNNCDIKDIKLKYLRDHIGYVNQDAVFFDFSLRDNMKLSNNDATDAEIINIINSVNMKSWFDKLEEGLDTRLGNQGNTLSGGEKQRLSIGRALLKPKLKLLLLDEATAALDYKTEKIV